MTITAAQQKQLTNLARAANRRIERASEGQRRALEYYTRNYHTRVRTDGMRVFQQGKARTEAEYKVRMKELQDFMLGDPDRRGDKDYAPITKRKGWESLKKQQVASAGKTFRSKGYDLTDEELEMIFIETEPQSKGGSDPVMLAAIKSVQIAKSNAGEKWELTPEIVREAMLERRSAQERAEALIKARKMAQLVREAREKQKR